jgi:hypothetical protein
MTKPNIFISHRWDYNSSYISLISKLNEYGLPHLNYSIPNNEPLDLYKTNQIKQALSEQIRQSNYFLIFANMAMVNSYWCKHEIDVARSYGKPILSVKPYNYTGHIPLSKYNQACSRKCWLH